MIFVSLLVLFSFYYTEKAIGLLESNDPLMKEIKDKGSPKEEEAINAKVEGDYLIPGYNGLVIDLDNSFTKMKGYGSYNDALLVFEEVEPNISIDDYYDKYISSGNGISTNIALVFAVDTNSYTLNVLNKYQNFIARNVDVSRLVNELLNVLKDALIYLKTNNLELLTSASLNSVKELASFLNESEINSYIDLLMECNKEFKISNNPLFTFEIYLLKLSSLNKSKPEITKKEVVKEVINIQPQKEIIEEKVEIAPKQEVKKTVVKPAILQKNPAEVDLKKINLDSSGLSNFISDDNLIKLLSLDEGILKDLKTSSLTSLIDE